jgi:hypothetical protein
MGLVLLATRKKNLIIALRISILQLFAIPPAVNRILPNVEE